LGGPDKERAVTEQSPNHFDAIAEMATAHKPFRSSLASAPSLIDSAVGDDHRQALIANYYVNVLHTMRGKGNT
jgi:hypothetical protein